MIYLIQLPKSLQKPGKLWGDLLLLPQRELIPREGAGRNCCIYQLREPCLLIWNRDTTSDPQSENAGLLMEEITEWFPMRFNWFGYAISQKISVISCSAERYSGILPLFVSYENGSKQSSNYLNRILTFLQFL
jgi:hypothetical protein